MRKKKIDEVQVAYLFILNYQFPFIIHVRQYELNIQIYEGENPCPIA